MNSVSVSLLSTDSCTANIPTNPELAVKKSDSEFSLVKSAQLIPTIGVVTRKEWIIPPRPKPGRKPATDTPPTKRKAQNRAAQRAFRERRAARVGELEEQLEEVKEGQQKREANLIEKIKNLEADVERFKTELNSWKLRCKTLDEIAEYEKRAKEAAFAELAYLNKNSQKIRTSASSVPLQPHFEKCVTQKQQNDDLHLKSVTGFMEASPEASASGSEFASVDNAVMITDSGCGNCTLGSSCECLEELIKDTSRHGSKSEYKRSHSLEANNFPEKRTRQLKPSTALEIDFTTHFSTKTNGSTPVTIEQIPSSESCGFCEEGTYCLCAEAVADSTVSNSNDKYDSRLVSISCESFPSSVISRSESKKAPCESSFPQNTVNFSGPGTCRQCQVDPRSGNFCRSLSALRELHNKTMVGCCGNNNDDCCKSTKISAENPPRLTCADAYKTLSSHQNYDEANDELSMWLGKLKAVTPVQSGRGPMEVEAASVMGVLKFFDRRFGRE